MTSLGKGIGPPWAQSSGRSSSPSLGGDGRTRYSTSNAPIKGPKPPNQNAGGGGNGGGTSGGGKGRGRGKGASSSDSPQPSFANVVLLHGMNGADGHTTFTDESGSAHGNATVLDTTQGDTAEVKYGTASMLTDGGADEGLTLLDNTDWDFGNSDFTVEGFVRWSSIPNSTTAALISHWRGDTNNRSWVLSIHGQTNGTVTFSYTTNGQAGTQVNVQSGNDDGIQSNTWHHLAASRASGTLRVFLDGVEVATADLSAVTIFSASDRLVIGGTRVASGSALSIGEASNAWVDEIRVTKGEGIYFENFTPPTVAFPRS